MLTERTPHPALSATFPLKGEGTQVILSRRRTWSASERVASGWKSELRPRNTALPLFKLMAGGLAGSAVFLGLNSIFHPEAPRSLADQVRLRLRMT